jgi:TonB family protein
MKPLRLALLSAVLASGSFAATPAVPSFADTPLKIVQSDDLPFYPTAALDAGLRNGEARLAVAIDATGRLTDYLVVGYTHRSFADVAVSAVKHWRFEPQRIHGLARGAVATLVFTFEAEGTIVNLNMFADDGSLTMLHYLSHIPTAFSACMPRDLDRIPLPVKIVQPLYPSGLGRGSHGGRVTVKYYIDEQGRVRLPRASSVLHQMNEELTGTALADAAVAAVAQWQFEPPLSKGKPTIVLVEQDFDFAAPAR